jgi:hypothetical protein
LRQSYKYIYEHSSVYSDQSEDEVENEKRKTVLSKIISEKELFSVKLRGLFSQLSIDYQSNSSEMTDDYAVTNILKEIELSKSRILELQNNLSIFIYQTLRNIAVIQTEIQYKLKKGIFYYHIFQNMLKYLWICRCGLDAQMDNRTQ